MSIKNKILAGILSGAMLFTGGIALNPVQAAPVTTEQEQGQNVSHCKHRHRMSDEQRAEFAKKFADSYGVNQAEVEAALKNRVHFEDIKIAATLAKLSGKSFSEVLEMKTDWRQVAEKLGVTREQMEEFMKQEMLAELAEQSKLDTKTVENLLKENYHPHDITIAGIIANASGKNVKSVIAKRKINNTWDDVAKEFKVDLKKIMEPERGEHRNKK